MTDKIDNAARWFRKLNLKNQELAFRVLMKIALRSQEVDVWLHNPNSKAPYFCGNGEPIIPDGSENLIFEDEGRICVPDKYP